MKIKDVVESYGIELKQQGKLWISFCPFHEDHSNPNFVVYESTNSFCCYACHKAGDVLTFIAEMEHIDRDEVKNKLALDILKHKLNELTYGSHEVNFKDETLLLASRMFYNFIHKNPFNIDSVVLVMRDFDEELSKSETLSYEICTGLLENLKKLLYNIGERR